MARHILVPLDGRALSFHALILLKAVARPEDTVEILTAFEPAPPVPIPDYRGAAESWAKTRHGKVREWLGPDFNEIKTTIIFRAPSVAIRDYALSVKPDLVVMATHGRGPVSRAWIGSVTDRLVRSGVSPVLVLRPDSEEEPSPERTLSLKSALVPVDGSDVAEEALGALWRHLGDDVSAHLVRVVEQGRPSAFLPQPAKEHDKAVEKAGAYLDDLAIRLKADGRSVTTQLIEAERPSVSIVATAQARGCDLIAMGTRGRGGLARIALGSTTDKVLRMSDLPILTIPPGGVRREPGGRD